MKSKNLFSMVWVLTRTEFICQTSRCKILLRFAENLIRQRKSKQQKKSDLQFVESDLRSSSRIGLTWDIPYIAVGGGRGSVIQLRSCFFFSFFFFLERCNDICALPLPTLYKIFLKSIWDTKDIFPNERESSVMSAFSKYIYIYIKYG